MRKYPRLRDLLLACGFSRFHAARIINRAQWDEGNVSRDLSASIIRFCFKQRHKL